MNPVELNYQTGQNCYYFRSSLASSTCQIFNNVTGLYENYNSANWSQYAISISEVSPGYYRGFPPSASVIVAATEIYFRRAGASPVITDAAGIGISQSQGGNADGTTMPIELLYIKTKNAYCLRSSLVSTTPYFYNTTSKIYEAYNASNWSLYAISVPECLPGYYRVIPPTESLTVQASEFYFNRIGATPAITDAPSIGQSQSQVSESISSSSSDVEIVNLALTHIGSNTINSLDDPTENARVSKVIFTSCRDAVLRACNWNFATGISTLTELTDQTVVNWDFVYSIPSDFLYIRKVYTDSSVINDYPFYLFFPANTNQRATAPPERFKIVYIAGVGKVIATNASPAYLEYTKQLTDSTQYDPMFIDSLSYLLAAKLANKLGGDAEGAQTMYQYYARSISEAMKCNGNENPSSNIKTSSYIDVR